MQIKHWKMGTWTLEHSVERQLGVPGGTSLEFSPKILWVQNCYKLPDMVMLGTNECWWQSFYLNIRMLMFKANDKRLRILVSPMIIKTVTYVTNISDLSPKYWVSNLGHQNRRKFSRGKFSEEKKILSPFCLN